MLEILISMDSNKNWEYFLKILEMFEKILENLNKSFNGFASFKKSASIHWHTRTYIPVIRVCISSSGININEKH